MKDSGPLFMPHGSIRGLLAFTLVIGVIICVIKGIEIPSELWVAFTMVIVLYFRDSVAELQNKKEEKITDDMNAMAEELKALKSSQPVVIPTDKK